MRRAAALVLACAALAAPACGGDDSGDGDGEPRLVVSAASSMTEALTACSPDFEGARVRLSFAGSDELAAQIRQGVKPDVYAAANTTLPEELEREGLLERPTEFVANTLVVAVPEDSGIDAVQDLARNGLTLAIGSESVPIGSYTREVLSRLPDAQAEAILANVRSNEPDVKGIVGKLVQGAVDAGLVYESDVKATGGELRAVRLPRRLRALRPLRRGRREGRRAAGPGAALRGRPGARGVPARAVDGRLPAARLSGPGRLHRAVGGRAGARDRVPDDSDPGDLHRRGAGRARVEPRRGERARGALAQPQDHRGVARDHPRGRDAGGLPAGHPLVPGTGAGGHADRAAARAPAGRRGHRAACGGRSRGHPRRDRRGAGHPALAGDRGRGGGPHLRRRALLHPPGAGLLRGGRHPRCWTPRGRWGPPRPAASRA